MSFLTFISDNPRWVGFMQEKFRTIPTVRVVHGDVRSLAPDYTVFVAPSNSLGFMDGGIAKVFNEWFPRAERLTRDRIHQVGFFTRLGRAYLPVGCAVSVPVGPTTGLISAPTMFLPQDISSTENVYHSTRAALVAFAKLHVQNPNYQNLVMTSHGCGQGMMDEETSAIQMYEAFHDFLDQDLPEDRSPAHDLVILADCDEEQPTNFDNREIRDISLDDLVQAMQTLRTS